MTRAETSHRQPEFNTQADEKVAVSASRPLICWAYGYFQMSSG